LLGGSIEFDIDLSRANYGVNSNFYTVSPPYQNKGASNYCDIQGKSNTPCMEMDIIEANGNCGYGSCWHQWPNQNGGCDQSGCGTDMLLPQSSRSGSVHFKVTFANDGWMAVFMNGQENKAYSRWPDDGAKREVARVFKVAGAVLESSSWTGFVPYPSKCGKGGNGDTSHFEVHNLVVQGTVVQGPEPTKCNAPAPPPPTPPTRRRQTPPPPPPTPPPPTPPAPMPSTCTCGCTDAGLESCVRGCPTDDSFATCVSTCSAPCAGKCACGCTGADLESCVRGCPTDTFATCVGTCNSPCSSCTGGDDGSSLHDCVGSCASDGFAECVSCCTDEFPSII